MRSGPREMRRSALLVEDDLDHVELFLRALRKAGIAADVTVANDGGEALEFLFATGEHADRDPRDLPQVILLDLDLPKMGGLEVLARIRANRHTRHLPVLVFTGSDEEEDVVKSYDLGANGFVRKPMEYDQFVEAFRQLRRLGLYWLMESVSAPPRHGRPA